MRKIIGLLLLLVLSSTSQANCVFHAGSTVYFIINDERAVIKQVQGRECEYDYTSDYVADRYGKFRTVFHVYTPKGVLHLEDY